MKLRPQLFSLLVVASSIWMVACDDSGQAGGAGGDRGGSLDDDGSDPAYNGPTCEVEGDAYCTGSASGIVCAEGSTNGVEFRCASGEECVDGACEGICDAGETECVGSAVQRVCAADGRSWAPVACADGRSCVDGECLLPGGLVCSPGERKCDGLDAALVCNEEGSGWDEEECPSDTACDEGACMGSVCAVGASKCADVLLAELPLPIFSGRHDVIYHCIDGSEWVAELCPSDEESHSVCVFDDVAPSVANAYQADVNQFFESAGAAPTPPALPSYTTASCEEVPDYCQERFGTNAAWASWYASSGDRSTCGDYSDTENVPLESWAAVSTCSGMPPFSALTVAVTECAGLTACQYPDEGEAGPSCYAVECLPTEAECADATSYRACDGFYWDDPTTCDGSSACANASTVDAERSVTCGGVAVEPWNPPT